MRKRFIFALAFVLLFAGVFGLTNGAKKQAEAQRTGSFTIMQVEPAQVTEEPKKEDDLTEIPDISEGYMVITAQFCDEEGFQHFWEKVFVTKQEALDFVGKKFANNKLYKSRKEVRESTQHWNVERNYWGSNGNIRRHLVGIFKIGEKIKVQKVIKTVTRFTEEWVEE